jgi:hypothetical protein
MEVAALPSSFLIRIKNMFLTHFYSRTAKMKVEADKEPNPLGSYI